MLGFFTIPTYTMNIEKPAGQVRQHGFHLGTIRETAERLVLEKLQADREIVSIALYLGGDLVHIYDFRDLPDYVEPED